MNPEFLVNLLRSPFYRMYIDVVSTGSIRDRLYFRDLRTIRVPVVSPTEQVVISEIVHRGERETRRLVDEITRQKALATGRLHGLVNACSTYASDAVDPEAAFKVLTDQWRRETGHYSSISRKVQHPAYQRIIAMKESAIPLILRELRERPAHWFVALRAITGFSPDSGSAGLKSATEAWLRWGKEHGYINDDDQLPAAMILRYIGPPD